MRRYLLNLLILCFVIGIFPLSSFAQTDTTGSGLPFQVFAYSAPKGIMLVIVGDWIIPAGKDNKSGYHIYRKENVSDSLKKITPFPLRASSSYSEMVAKVGKGLSSMFPVVGVDDSSQFWQLLIDQDESVAVWGTLFRKFRAAMGQLYFDYDVEVGKTYIYSCTKTDASGRESTFSQKITVIAGTPLFDLLGPVNLNAEAKDNQTMISWNVNDLDSAAFSYNIYRSYDSLGRYVRLNSEMIVPMFNDDSESESEMSFVDSLAQNGRRYFYTVVSVDYAENESSRTKNIVSVFPQDTQAPAVPKNVKSESGTLGISIVWELSTEIDIAGYGLYRSVDVDSPFVKIHNDVLPLNANKYEDKTAHSGDEYFYRITAIDQAGNESDQSANVYGYFLDPSLPLPPMNLKALVDSGKITLSWKTIIDDELLGYYIFRASSYNGDFSQVSELIVKEDSIWVDTSALSSYSTYYYAMKSSTINGAFSYYNEAVGVTPMQIELALPEPPTDFFGYADYTGTRLQWKMPLDKTVYGYNVYRKDISDIIIKLNDSILIFDQTTYLDTMHLLNQNYTYFIKSVHFEGTEGLSSHSVDILPLAVTPEPPNNFRAVVKSQSITLKWDASLLGGMKGYNIYKHTGDGAFKLVNNKLVDYQENKFVDNKIKLSQRYFYTITTVSNDNRESFHSTVIDVLVK